MSSPAVNLKNYLIPLDEINRATENFSHERCLGEGGFGKVYKGQLSERWQNRTAAIKRRSSDSYQGKREFCNELEMISRFHHENVISFIGYCDEGVEMIIVYEYALKGSLDYYLADPSKMSCITWTQRLKICIGAAKGLDYLHSGIGKDNRVIHRDIKSANILLDGNLVAKICDFGLSKLAFRNQQDTQVYTKVAGTQFYLDPTYHESHILRKESDIYSFGVVLFEILSGMLVYHKRSIGGEEQIMMNIVRRYQENEPDKVIDPCIRDQINCGSFDTFKEIAYQCISYNSKERPKLQIIIKKIEEALSIQMSEHSASAPTDLSIIKSLFDKLNSIIPYDQWIASSEISRLTKISTENRVAFAQIGVIPLLTNLLTATDTRTQEHAVTALLNLSIYEDNKGSILSSAAVQGIVHLLKKGSMVARENAAATLFSLSVTDQKDLMNHYEEAISPLVLLLSEGTERGKRMAANSLFNLCIYDEGNKIKAVRAGVVPMLIKLLTEPEGVLKDKALAILTILSSHLEGRLAMGSTEAVSILVEVIGSGSQRNKENAVEVLVELCLEDQMYLGEAQELGAMKKIMDLLGHATERGKRKARQLQERINGHYHDHYHYDTEDVGVDNIGFW